MPCSPARLAAATSNLTSPVLRLAQIVLMVTIVTCCAFSVAWPFVSSRIKACCVLVFGPDKNGMLGAKGWACCVYPVFLEVLV